MWRKIKGLWEWSQEDPLRSNATIPVIAENGLAQGRGHGYGHRCLEGWIYYQTWWIRNGEDWDIQECMVIRWKEQLRYRQSLYLGKVFFKRDKKELSKDSMVLHDFQTTEAYYPLVDCGSKCWHFKFPWAERLSRETSRACPNISIKWRILFPSQDWTLASGNFPPKSYISFSTQTLFVLPHFTSYGWKLHSSGC